MSTRYCDAVDGSAMLRDAILRAKGYPPPPPPPKRVWSFARPRSVSCGAVTTIQAHVCEHFGLDRLEMTTIRRDNSGRRQIAMYLARKLTPASYPEIARRFGGRDHTTVMHAVKVVEQRIMSDPTVAEDVRVLSEALAG